MVGFRGKLPFSKIDQGNKYRKNGDNKLYVVIQKVDVWAMH